MEKCTYEVGRFLPHQESNSGRQISGPVLCVPTELLRPLRAVGNQTYDSKTEKNGHSHCLTDIVYNLRHIRPMSSDTFSR